MDELKLPQLDTEKKPTNEAMKGSDVGGAGIFRTIFNSRVMRMLALSGAITTTATLASCDDEDEWPKYEQDDKESNRPLFGGVTFTYDSVNKKVLCIGKTLNGDPADITIKIQHADGLEVYSQSVSGFFIEHISLNRFKEVYSIELIDDNGRRISVPKDHLEALTAPR